MKTLVVLYPTLVGCLLTQKREERGLSQAGLAKLAGMTQGPLGRIELGKASCSMEHLLRISDSLGVMPSAILEQADLHLRSARSAGIQVRVEALDDEAELLRQTVVMAIKSGPEFWPALAQIAPTAEARVTDQLGDYATGPMRDRPTAKALARMLASTLDNIVQAQLGAPFDAKATTSRLGDLDRRDLASKKWSRAEALARLMNIDPVFMQAFAMGPVTDWIVKRH